MHSTTEVSTSSDDALTGQVLERNISTEMRQMYLDYALSIITDRSLPDVRDGLKPVHRRILFAMHELGNNWNSKYRKSARIVGDVLGKYHPHGDTACYDAMVRMAQDFSLLHPLVDGQGNFGSVDGDSPAAMRYTETRLARIAESLLADLSPKIVPYVPNYDGELSEPSVLPAGFPNLLINGSVGIAVGMATYIPPHNLRQVIRAVRLLSADPTTPSLALFEALGAPDFPTGGIVYNTAGLLDAIETGRGTVRVRAKWHAESHKGRYQSLVITEIPYQICKKDLVEKTQAYFRSLAESKTFTDVSAIRDESDKDGMRIVIDLKPGVEPEPVFSMMAGARELSYDVSCNYNCMALLPNGKPDLLPVRHLLLYWMQYRREVIANRLSVELDKQRVRLHILEGYRLALSRVDEVIEVIRASVDAANASIRLRALLDLDEIQAKSILDLRLQKLTSFEIGDIHDEHARRTAEAARLQAALNSPEDIEQILLSELDAMGDRFGMDRRTEIGEGLSTVTREDMIPLEDVLILVTRSGYIKRMPASAFEAQNRGTRGRKALEVAEGDEIALLYHCASHDTILLFQQDGQVHGVKAWRIPEGAMTAKGTHLRRVFEDFEGEVQAIVVLPEGRDDYTVMTVTAQAQVKRSNLGDYDNATRKGGIRGVKLDEGDALIGAFIVGENDHVVLVNNEGFAIRFPANDVRPTGRATGGVRGMKLQQGRQVIGVSCIPVSGPLPMRHVVDEDTGETRQVLDTTQIDAGRYLLCIGEKGVGKRTSLSEFPVQSRAGKGVIAFKANGKTGPLIAAMGAQASMDLILLASNGVSNRIRVQDIRETGRSASGVFLINLDQGATLLKATPIVGTEATPPSDAPKEGEPAFA